MATVESTPRIESYRDESYLLLEDAGWELYDRLDAWAAERAGVRIVYIDGDVVIMGISRRHDWYSRRLHDLIWAFAHAAGVTCEDAGSTTFREQAKKAGAQADETYYFGENALRMAGPKNFEPGIDPVPDLAIEVEVGHPVDQALRAWARLGVSEVWHLDATRDALRFRVLRLSADGASYAPVEQSGFFPASGAKILGLLTHSLAEGSQNWRDHLSARVAQVLANRGEG